MGASAAVLQLALLFVPFIATPCVCTLVTAVQPPHE